MNRLLLIIIFPTIVLCLSACSASQRKIMDSPNETLEWTNSQQPDTIAFLLFIIKYNKNKTATMLTYKGITKTPGKLKDENR